MWFQLGIGGVHGISERTARDMYQLCRPAEDGKPTHNGATNRRSRTGMAAQGEWQEDKSVEQFCGKFTSNRPLRVMSGTFLKGCLRLQTSYTSC